MKHGFFNITTEVNDPGARLQCGFINQSIIKDAATEKSSNKLWSSNTISHPYLALYNERWWFHSGLLFLFDPIKSASLQLLFTLCARTHCLRLSAYCISLSVWDDLSLPLRFCFPLCCLSPCGFLLLSKTACLSLCLWFFHLLCSNLSSSTVEAPGSARRVTEITFLFEVSRGSWTRAC